MNGLWNILFSFIFVWIIFTRIGYFQEIIIGSKKTAFIWTAGVLTIGLFQLFLTKNDSAYYYGTKYLGWISIGCLFYVFLFQCKNNDQLRLLIRGLLLRSILFLFIFEFLQYQSYTDTTLIIHSSFVFSAEYYIYFSIFSFVCGFFFTLAINYKELDKFTQNVILFFFGVIVITLIVFAVLNYTSGITSTKTMPTITEKIEQNLNKLTTFS